MFGSLGFTELILILFIVLIIFGAGKLPQLGEGFGKAIKGFKKSVHEADAIEAEAQAMAQQAVAPQASGCRFTPAGGIESTRGGHCAAHSTKPIRRRPLPTLRLRRPPSSRPPRWYHRPHMRNRNFGTPHRSLELPYGN